MCIGHACAIVDVSGTQGHPLELVLSSPPPLIVSERWTQVIWLCDTCPHLPSHLTPPFQKVKFVYLPRVGALVPWCTCAGQRTTFGESVFSLYPAGPGNQVKELRPGDPSKDLTPAESFCQAYHIIPFNVILFMHGHSHPPHLPLGCTQTWYGKSQEILICWGCCCTSYSWHFRSRGGWFTLSSRLAWCT